MTYRETNVRVAPEQRPVTIERVERRSVPRRVVHEDVVVPVVEPVAASGSPADGLRRIVWLVFGVLQALIVIRILLLLLGANEANDIVAFVIGVTDPLVEPFRGMFRLDAVSGASGSVLDVAAIVALVAWTLVEALVLGIIGLTDRRDHRRPDAA